MSRLLLSLALLTTTLFTSSTKDLNLAEVTFDKGVYKFKDRKVTGNIVDYYENDQLKLSYTVVEGRLHGDAFEYFADGKVKSKHKYVFGKLFGKYTIYFPSGNIKLEMNVKENAYGFGEKVDDLKIATKDGKKPKTKGEAKLIFKDSNGQAQKSSEGLAIEEQFKFELRKNDKVLYTNE